MVLPGGLFFSLKFQFYFQIKEAGEKKIRSFERYFLDSSHFPTMLPFLSASQSGSDIKGKTGIM